MRDNRGMAKSAREEIFQKLRYATKPMPIDEAGILLDNHQREVTRETAINILIILGFHQNEMSIEEVIKLIKVRYAKILEQS